MSALRQAMSASAKHRVGDGGRQSVRFLEEAEQRQVMRKWAK